MAFSADSYIGTFAPSRLALDTTDINNKDDRAFIAFCERLEDEGRSYRQQLNLDEQIQRAWELYEGRHYAPKKGKEHRARVAANLIHAYLERKSSMLTDAMPELNVRSRTGNESTSSVLQEALRGVWDEKSVQDLLLRAIVSSAVVGQVAVGCEWDSLRDYGNGDIVLPLYQFDECLIDPHVRSVAELQDEAEYVLISQSVPLTKIHEMFPERGRMVRADKGLTEYETHRQAKQSSYVYQRPGREQDTRANSAIPRARLKKLYFRDRTVDPSNPHNEETDSPNYLFPRKRVMIWAGNVPLYDGNGKYWDGLYPVELMDWGIEPRHQYGKSEMRGQASLQIAFDLLLSSVVDNARLINDPPWLIDEDAVTPQVLQEIRRYGDRMGWPIVKQHGRQVDRNPPGALSSVVFQTMQIIQNLMEMITGVVDVVQGRQPGQVESGIAIQSLQLASQVTIRRQARQVEGFLQRIGRLMVSRIIQFYTDQRVFHVTNEWNKTAEFTWRRAEFIRSLIKAMVNESMDEAERQQITERALREAFKDTVMSIVPMSGLPETVNGKVNITTAFFKEGIVAPDEVLKAARWSEPKEALRKADEYKIEQAMLQAQIEQALQGQGQMPTMGGGRASPIPQRGEMVPPIQKSAPGGQSPPSESGE